MFTVSGRRARGLVALFPILVGLLLPAAPIVADERPTIGLALSGGGARGAAHIGALKVIEDLGIRVDYIAGTSMGSVIGGLYAMGLSPAEIEASIEEIDWAAIFHDEPPRAERRMRRKLDDRTFLIKARPGVDERERRVNLVPALVQGHRLDLALRRYTLPARQVQDFDALPIPFRAVATDVVTGEAVILGDGDLATAIRASMAVPAAFAPVDLGDRLLVDGGLAMNLPISVVRAMGADIVIAVDVGGPRRDRSEITNVLQMLDQVSGLVTWRNTQEEIATLREGDVLIVPPLERRVQPADFDRMRDAIAIGEQGATAKHTELAAVRRAAAGSFAAASAPPLDRSAPIIDRVRIENRSRLDDRLIAERLEVPLGAPLNTQGLEAQLDRVIDQDNFETLHYRVADTPDGETELIVTATAKSWGTSSFQAGMELSSASGGNSWFNVGLAYTMAPVNPLNAEWRTLLTGGEEPGLLTEFYQPLDPRERWYLEVDGGYVTESLTLFDPSQSDRPSTKYLLTRIGGSLEFGRNLGAWGRLGLRYGRYAGDADLRYGDPGFSGYSFDAGELTLSFQVDTLDNPSFPRDGWFGSAFALTSRRALGASDDYDQAGFGLLHSRGWGRNSLLTGLSLAGNLGGNDVPQSLFRLGGFANLSGFNQLELAGANIGLIRGLYLREIGTGFIKTYAGAALETGNVWARRSDIGFDSLRVAGSLFVGADTPIGPLYLGYGHADGGYDAVYLFLGRPWSTPTGGRTYR